MVVILRLPKTKSSLGGKRMNYREMAEAILKLVGNEENVLGLTHCVTRLRFNLKDETLVNTEEIKNIKGVMGVVKQGGQYQVIIGKEVANVFAELEQMVGNLGAKKSELSDKKMSLWDKFTSTVSGIFTPILGVLAACGILKGLLTAATVFGVMAPDSGVYTVLYAIGDSIYYFMPILLGGAAAERFGINKYLGMIVGGSMIYPSIISAAEIEGFTFLHIPMGIQNYTSTVFPAIIAVYAASVLYKQLKKICPKVIQFFAVPLLTLIIIVPLSLLIIGPVISKVSELLLVVMNAAYNLSPLVCGLLLGGPWLVLVMFGLHWAFIPLFIVEFMSVGSVSMMGLLGANQFAAAGAMFAVAAKVKNDPDLKGMGISTGITCLLGISEPGIYGVLLPRKKPFITTIIAGSLGAIPAALMGAKVYAVGASGLFAIPAGINPAGIDMGFYGSILAIVLGFVLGFILTYFFGVDKEEME